MITHLDNQFFVHRELLGSPNWKLYAIHGIDPSHYIWNRIIPDFEGYTLYGI